MTLAMSCPKCGATHAIAPANNGLLTCTTCQHRWAPTVATLDSLPTQAMERRPVVRVPLLRPISDEYLPDEPSSAHVRNVPLTERHDQPPGEGSSLRRALDAAAAAAAAESRPSSPAQSSTLRRLRSFEVGPPATSSNRPDQGPTMDADLFDRLENEAQARRADLPTVMEPRALAGTEPPTDLPTSDRSHSTDCPVCGHRVPAGGNKHHQCPQCGTGWDDSSGRLKVSPTAGDTLIGRTLGGCLIDRKLGEGGMGAVYHARQLSLDRSIAIKILPADLARNRNFIQRFEREAKSLAKINHPNILHIYDFGEDPQLGLYFMLIEYVEGMDLGEVLNRRGALGQIETLDLLRQSLLGLEAAAEKGVIHRDIKPDNLMVSNTGLVKVSDFGLAKGMIAHTGVTAAGVRVGTPAFMSPEQCDGIEVDVRSDIYNLGATAFLCMTGRLPFDGETPFAIMLKHKTEPVPSLIAIDPTIDRGVDRLIQRMLAKRPDDRCSSLRDLIEQVEKLEVALAGTQSILRKSRGPFRALLNGEPTLPVIRSDRNPARQELPPPQESPPRLDDDWQQLVADFQAHAPVSIPVPVPAPAPISAFPVAPSGVENPGRGGRPSSRLNIPAAAVNPARGSASSRRLDTELAQARTRGRRQEIDALINEGDLHELGGRVQEAGRAWEAAARLTDDDDQRAELIVRAGRLRATERRQRLILRLALVGAGLATMLAVLGLAAPPIHGRLVDHRLGSLVATLPPLLPAQRAAELRAFAAKEGRPWWWYTLIFRRGYAIPSADRALALADQEAAPAAPVAVTVASTGDSQSVLRMADNPQIPWSEVLNGARQLRGADAVTQEVLRRAGLELERQRADVDAIQAEWAAGDHRRALERAVTFRTRHPRAETALLATLPVPGLVKISAAGAILPADLQVRADGLVVQIRPGAADLSLESPICRRLDRSVTIEVSASGYRTAVESLEPGPRVATATVVLRPQPLWAIPGSEPQNEAVLIPVGTETVLVDRRSHLWLIGLRDGRIQSRLERTPGVPTALRGLLIPAPAGRWLAGLDDGSFVQLSPDLVMEQSLHRGRAPVMGWAEGDLTYRPGKRVRLIIEDAAPRTLVALDGAREWWRYPDVRRSALGTTLPTYLLHREDLVFLIDDTAVHVIDEDGGAARVFALAARRSGPVVVRQTPAGRLDLFVPTVAGVQHLVPGSRSAPLRQVSEPWMMSVPPTHLALAGEVVLVATADALVAVEPGAAKPRWRLPLASPLAWTPTSDGTQVVIADATGGVALIQATTGVIQRRLAHGTPLAAPPVVVGQQVVLLDQAGTLTAYPR